MKDLMIDIETLDTRPTAVITQIGACYFDRNTGEIGKTFCKNINIDDCLAHGLTVSGDTIEWWMSQVTCTWTKGTMTLKHVLLDLIDFAVNAESAWAHATFDFPIIQNAIKVLHLPLFIKYWQARDLRTLVDLSGLDYSELTKDLIKTHDALEDCRNQVAYAVKCFNELRSK